MIFIKGNVPSSKNSKRWTGKKLISSKTVEKYMNQYAYQYFTFEIKKEFQKMTIGKNKPYKIEFYFIRDSKRKFDLINVAQLPCDLMVKAGLIEDDNADEIIPVFKGYRVDKNNPGVEINIL